MNVLRCVYVMNKYVRVAVGHVSATDADADKSEER